MDIHHNVSAVITIFIVFAKSLNIPYVLQGPQAKRTIQSMSLYFMRRVAKIKFLGQIMKVTQATLPDVMN